ncbi:hypothetical protein R3P38DRAFT_2906367 [Favolaschia claudopus]|uniref:Uncharacterized protein n=1 Tax=Favolaschia claudopus TaxID=2862362 RepID=A0AAW0CHV0_9AGAR
MRGTPSLPAITTATTFARRLMLLLESSPHLLPYIRSLHVRSQDVECFHVVSAISWEQLQHLRVSFNAKDQSPVQRRGYIEGMAVLFSIPSLSAITITAHSKWTVDELRFLLSSCSPNTQQLEMYSCGVLPEVSLPSPPPAAHRPRIRDLTLKLSPSLLTALSAAFDFTHLHTFRYSQSWTPELNAFLRRYGSTVQGLSVSNKYLRLKGIALSQDRRRPDATLTSDSIFPSSVNFI